VLVSAHGSDILGDDGFVGIVVGVMMMMGDDNNNDDDDDDMIMTCNFSIFAKITRMKVYS